MGSQHLITLGMYSLLILALIFSGAPVSHANSTTVSPSINGKNYVVFESSGLPSNLNYTVKIGNNSYTSVSDYLNITLPDGTYNYTILLPYDYSSNISNGQVTLNNTSQFVHFAVSYKNYGLGYLILVSIVLSLVSILVFVGYYIKLTRK